MADVGALREPTKIPQWTTRPSWVALDLSLGTLVPSPLLLLVRPEGEPDSPASCLPVHRAEVSAQICRVGSLAHATHPLRNSGELRL